MASMRRPVTPPAHDSLEDQSAENVPYSVTMWLALAVLLLMATGAVACASRWPLVNDAPLIHYVIFLMAHGMRPYRDIIEMNMPGTYMYEWLGMHLLGGGALGWWLWDVFWGATAIAASAWITGRGKRCLGIGAGCLLYVVHLIGGAMDLGQREWVMTSMLLVAFAFLFEAKRKSQPGWMMGFIGFCGLAAAIKPPAIGLGLAALVAICWLEWQEARNQAVNGVIPQWKTRVARMIGWSLAGGLIPGVLCVWFLARWGVTKDFLELLHGLAPWYAGLGGYGFLSMTKRAYMLILLLVMAGSFALLRPRERSLGLRWETYLLAGTSVASAALYVIQHKGFAYHLYPAIGFAAIWAMLELERALRASKRQRQVASACLALLVFGSIALMARTEIRRKYSMLTITRLENDLNSLGGSALTGKVQCLDMTQGSCINVLYRMKLVQSTGFIYDYYLFPKDYNPVPEALKARFLAAVEANPPQVFVFSGHQWPGDLQQYTQLNNWPAFSQFLNQKYRLYGEQPVVTRTAGGYRIYVLKDRTVDTASSREEVRLMH